MIVVVVIGVLAAIAYPSYQGQMQRTRRADGKAALLNVAQQLERCYTLRNRYDDVGNCTVLGALPFDSPEGFYSIDVDAGTLDTNFFALSATPQGAQADDATCGVLGYRSSGLQTSLGVDDDAANCW
jgi:type IV pilus assembly protein PilE